MKTERFNVDEYITTPEDEEELLRDAFESGSPEYIAHALGIIARARGMTAIAKEAGVAREALYRSLSANGDPRLSTLLGVLKALHITLQPQMHNAAEPHAASPVG